MNICRIQHKIKSQSGASITYALLLFLVCATVSSVILAAGTAASGRISQSVDTDRRYYAVTSAARLLKDVYEQYEICIEQIAESANSPSDDDYTIFDIKKREIGGSYTRYDENIDKIITLHAAELFVNSSSEQNPKVSRPFSLVVTPDNSDDDAILVSCIEKLNVISGTITLDITGTGAISTDSTDVDAFSLRLTFIPSIKVSDEVRMKDNMSNEDNYRIKKTQISWKMISAEIINVINENGDDVNNS